MHAKRICSGLLFFSLLCISVIAVAQDKVVISRIDDGVIEKTVEPVLMEAYKQIGITFTIQQAPAERALIEANEGTVDGDLIRKAGLEQNYPNLVMVPVSVVPADWVVFTKKVKFPVKGWESLKPYSIVFQRGLKFAEDNTEGMNRTMVTSMVQMFKMLADDRVDVALAVREEGLVILKMLGISEIKILEPSLKKIPLYHYLHKKHGELVPKLAAVLQKMEQEGRTKEIQDEVLQKLLMN